MTFPFRNAALAALTTALLASPMLQPRAAAQITSSPILTPYTPQDGATEYPMWEDGSGNLYAKHFTVNYGVEAFATPSGVASVSAPQASTAYPSVGSDLNALSSSHGSFTMTKAEPSATWGDRTRPHPDGGTFEVSEWSQVFVLEFGSPEPVAAVEADLWAMDHVVWASGPLVFRKAVDPPDDAWTDVQDYIGPNGETLASVGDYEQWYLRRIEAERAWGLAKGRGDAGPVVIGISDFWGSRPQNGTAVDTDTYGSNSVHPDFGIDPGTGQPRLDNSAIDDVYVDAFEQHGARVAGLAGAITGNTFSIGQPNGAQARSIASLGWNVALKGFWYGSSGIRMSACLGSNVPPGCEPVDVLNMSWITGNASPSNTVCMALSDAMAAGVVAVAASGNFESTPRPFAPAACASPTGRQVIAVSATNYYDGFPQDGNGNVYNFSPCGQGYANACDPEGDPFKSFIDFAAPGREILTIQTLPPGTSNDNGYCPAGNAPCHTQRIVWGTSSASPIASALVALALSVNPDLTTEQVRLALAETAVKVGNGQAPYSNYGVVGLNGNTWNRYHGYGRIDAYEMLKYVIENYGGRVGQPGETVVLPEAFALQPGVSLAVRSGATLLIEDELSLPSGSALVAEGTARLVVGPGATLKSVDQIEIGPSAWLQVKDGGRVLMGQSGDLYVEGTLTATDGAVFSELVANQGWLGIRFRPGSVGRLISSTDLQQDRIYVRKRRGYGTYSVHAENANVTMNNVSVEQAVYNGAILGGVYMTGSSGRLEMEDSFVTQHRMTGIQVNSGAKAYLTRVDVQYVDGNGIASSNANVFVHDSKVTGVQGYGLATAGFTGYITLGIPGFSPFVPENTELRQNVGGDLRANSYGSMSAGDQGQFQNNSFYRRQAASSLHANVHSTASITAKYNYWGRSNGPDPAYYTVQSGGYFAFCPWLTSAAGSPGGNCGGGGGSSDSRVAGGASGPSAKLTGFDGETGWGEEPPIPEGVEGDLVRARRAAEAGEYRRALRLVKGALRDADSPEVRARVAAHVVHFVRMEADEEALEALARLADRAGERPLALRMLAAAFVGTGRSSDALAAADALVAIGPEHAAAGHAFAALAEAELGRYAEAQARIGLAQAALTEGSDDAGLVEDAATDVALRADAASGGGAERIAPVDSEPKVAASLAAEPAPTRTELGRPMPNPTAGRVEMALALADGAAVEAHAYDVLGRRVATLADGALEAGNHRLGFDASALPPGLYVVRCVVRVESGAAGAFTQKVTVAR